MNSGSVRQITMCNSFLLPGLILLCFGVRAGDGATIVTEESTIQTYVGELAVLPCTVTGLLASETVVWQFIDHNVNITDGTSIVSTAMLQRYSLIRSEGQSSVWNLQISWVQAEDRGTYKCFVLGTDESVTVHLKVVDAPPKPVIPPMNVTGCCREKNVQGDCIRLCNPSAYTTQQLLVAAAPGGCIDDHLFDILVCGNGGRNLVGCCIRNNVNGICLDMCGTENEQAPDYSQCLLSTMSIVTCYEEGLELIPTMPTGVKAQNTPSGLVIYWEAPLQNAANVTQYKVLYKKKSDSAFSTSIQTRSDLRYMTFKSLENGKRYQFRVIAISAFGASMPSNMVEIVFDEDPDTFNHYNFTVRDCCASRNVSSRCQAYCTSDFFLTGLNPDSISHCYGELEDIYFCLANQKNHIPCCNRVEIPDHCLGLCSGQHIPLTWNLTATCMIRLPVIAACLMEGSFDLPPPPSYTVIAPGSVTDTSVTIEWGHPMDYRADTFNYVVGWKLYNTSDSTFQTALVDGMVYTITGLSPLMWYEVMVVSQNVNGTSLPGAALVFMTEEKQSDVVPTPYNETECCIQKNMPDVNRCLPLCNHTFRMTNQSLDLGLSCTTGLVTMLECASDGRNHSECCKRRGVSDNCRPLCEMGVEHNLRDGNELQFIFCTAYVEPISLCFEEGRGLFPRTPENFSASSITESQVVLNWKKPEGGPEITGYVVESTTDPLFQSWPTVYKAISTHYVADGLLQNTKYYFRVMSKNTEGSSLPSPVVSATTMGAPLSTNITNRNWTSVFQNRTHCCTNSNLTSICEQQCTNGTADTNNCLPDIDKIIACGADGRDHTTCCSRYSNFPTTCLPYCSGQPPVRDSRAALCIPYMGMIFTCFAEGADQPPTPPRSIAVSSLSYDTMVVTWLNPKENCNHNTLCQFILYYWQADDVYQDNMQRMEAASPQMLTKLEPDTEYRITVVASNRFGLSLPGSSLLVRTTKDPYQILSIYQSPVGILNKGTDSASLTCTAISSPAPTGFQWLFNTNSLGSTSTVILMNIAARSEGNYTCRVTFPPTITREKKWMLNVRYEPRPVGFTEELVHPGINQNAVLRCQFRGFPNQVKWYKDDSLVVDHTKFQQYDIQRDLTSGLVMSRLDVKSVVVADFGKYKCTGINEFGSQSISGQLTNIGDRKPVPTEDPKLDPAQCCRNKNLPENCISNICTFAIDMNAILQDTSLYNCLDYVSEVLSCAADGRSHTKCCASKGISDYCLPFCDGILPESDNIFDHLQCLVHVPDIFNCVQSGHDLIPSQPNSVTANVKYDNLEVHWSPPSKNPDKIQLYEIFYQTGSQPAQFETASKSTTSTSIKNIKKGNTYFIWVVAKNDFGKSSPSQNVSVNITRLTPSEPLDFEAVLVANATIRLNWKTPRTDVTIVEYVIHFQAIHGTVGPELTQRTPFTTFRLDRLLPNNAYQIYVTATSEDGEGKPSVTQVVNTHVSQIPVPTQQGGDSNQRTVAVAVGVVLGLVLLLAAIVVAFFLYRRYKAPVSTGGSVAFENPRYGNNDAKISGLPDENAAERPPRNQFSYGHLHEDHGYTDINDVDVSRRNPLYDNSQQSYGGRENPGYYDNKAADLRDEGPATLNLEN